MGSRTISVPQRSGLLAEPVLYETISRVVAGINSALTVAMAPSAATTPSGTLTLTNPVVRLNGPGTIRTIGPVDFDVPIYLIAGSADVQLETGGNIGSALTVTRGTVCALVREAATGIWWPIAGGGGSSAAIPTGRTAATTALTITAVGNVTGVDLTGASSSVNQLLRSPAVYVHGEQMVIHNADPALQIILDHLGTASPFALFFPDGANLRLEPGGSAVFACDTAARYWRRLVPA